VYVVEEFPLGTLDKILKNKLREMADERPPVWARRCLHSPATRYILTSRYLNPRY